MIRTHSLLVLRITEFVCFFGQLHKEVHTKVGDQIFWLLVHLGWCRQLLHDQLLDRGYFRQKKSQIKDRWQNFSDIVVQILDWITHRSGESRNITETRHNGLTSRQRNIRLHPHEHGGVLVLADAILVRGWRWGVLRRYLSRSSRANDLDVFYRWCWLLASWCLDHFWWA